MAKTIREQVSAEERNVNIISEIIKDIEKAVDKMENNTALVSDYSKFQEIMELLGIDDHSLQETLQNNGFSGWSDYRDARNNTADIVKVRGVLGVIKGTAEAVISALKKLEKNS